MIQNPNLNTLLREFLKRVEGRPAVNGYLTYRPGSKLWGFFDASLVNDVWAAFNDPTMITLLHLEPDAVASLVDLAAFDSIATAIARFAVFHSPRPQMLGLHHFVEIDLPDNLKHVPTEEPPGQLN